MYNARVLIALLIILGLIIIGQRFTNQTRKISLTPASPKLPAESEVRHGRPRGEPTATPSTATPKDHQNQAMSDFQYPRSIIISLNSNFATFESSDDPKKITDWYKNKIKDMGMNTTSFVQTSTNGNVLNKLVGADGNQKVRVEINKHNNSAIVKIVVVVN